MSDYTILKDIDLTIKHLLVENLDGLISPGDIVFKSPVELQEGKKHLLSIFLFRVEENAHLKNQQVQNQAPASLRAPSVLLDLYYIITPFAEERDEEHLVLGRVIQIFRDNAILKGSILKEGLEGTDSQLRVTLQPLPFEEVFQLWQGFTEKSFKLSVCYKVTPVEISSTKEIEIKRVREKRTGYNQLELRKEDR